MSGPIPDTDEHGVSGRSWIYSAPMEPEEAAQTGFANPGRPSCGSHWKWLGCTLVKDHTGPHVGGMSSTAKAGDWDNWDEWGDVGPDPGL